MIESVYKSINPSTGILYILVNTKDIWQPYQLSRITIKGKIGISFFYDVEEQPGEFNEHEELEYIDINENFDCFDYQITSSQRMNQITIIAIPIKYFIGDKFFKRYD